MNIIPQNSSDESKPSWLKPQLELNEVFSAWKKALY
jgi:hypothetical protein